MVGHGEGLRVENRLPGADVNPYLALSALIAAGLHGIDNELELEPAFEGNAYESDKPRVPHNIYDARDAFAASHEATIRPDARMDWRRALELMGYALAYRPSLLPLAYGRPLRKALAAGDPVAAVGDDFGPDIPLHTVSAWRQAVGARALPRLSAFVETTRAQARHRVARLRQLRGVTVFADAPGHQGTWPFLLLTLPTEGARDQALRQLWTAGLGVSRLFIHALPDYGYLRGIVDDAPLPNARDFAARSLTVTNSPWLDDAAFESICQVLESSL